MSAHLQCGMKTTINLGGCATLSYSQRLPRDECTIAMWYKMTINLGEYVTLPCSQRLPRDNCAIAMRHEDNNQPGRICDSSLQSKTTKRQLCNCNVI
eukprot:2905773-Ditylum_brightwellii.AAC.1